MPTSPTISGVVFSTQGQTGKVTIGGGISNSITITGTGFQSGCTIGFNLSGYSFNPNPIHATFGSSTSISGTFTLSKTLGGPLPNQITIPITVTNPDGGQVGASPTATTATPPQP